MENKRKKTLVVVDFQRDFYHPEGALYVKGAEKKLDNVGNAIKKVDNVVYTLDWHPSNHCSFKDNGGPWPVHCVEGTEGAGIPVEFIKYNKKYKFYKKGMNKDKEEYGAFSESRDLIQTALCFSNSDDIIVCGIAAEYCVLETLKNIKKYIETWTNFDGDGYVKKTVSVYLDGVAKFDSEGTVLEDYMKENGIKEFKFEN